MRKYLIKVDDELWNRFKQNVTKDRTINEVIVDLIVQYVEEREESIGRIVEGDEPAST